MSTIKEHGHQERESSRGLAGSVWGNRQGGVRVSGTSFLGKRGIKELHICHLTLGWGRRTG